MARYIQLVGCARYLDQDTGKMFEAKSQVGTAKVYPVSDELAERLLEEETPITGRAMFLETNEKLATKAAKAEEELSKPQEEVEITETPASRRRSNRSSRSQHRDLTADDVTADAVEV